MPVFNPDEFIEFLVGKKSTESFEIRRKNQGPGKVNIPKLALGEDNAWEKYSYNQPKLPDKIILSNGAWRFFAPLAFDIHVISFLLSQFAVTVWTGDDKSFARARPVKTEKEAWNDLQNNMIPRSREVIYESLANQGLECGAYVIIDFDYYCEIVELFLFNPDFKKSSSFPNYHFFESSNLLQNLYGNYTAKLVEDSMNLSPHIESRTERQLLSHFLGELLQKKGLSGEINNYSLEKLQEIRKLAPLIESMQVSFRFDNANIAGDYKQRIKELSLFSKLKRLKLRCAESMNAVGFNGNQFPQLVELSLDNFVSFSYPRTLKSLSLTNVKDKEYGIFDTLSLTVDNASYRTLRCLNVESLTISNCIDLKTISINKNLKNLTLIGCPTLTMIDVENESILTKTQFEEFHFDFSKLVNLQKLILDVQPLNLYRTTRIVIDKFPENLKILELTECFFDGHAIPPFIEKINLVSKASPYHGTLSNLPCLKELILHSPTLEINFFELPSIEIIDLHISSLNSFHYENCNKNLVKLTLSGDKKSNDVIQQILSKIDKIKYLAISRVPVKLSALKQLNSLQNLKISNCELAWEKEETLPAIQSVNFFSVMFKSAEIFSLLPTLFPQVNKLCIEGFMGVMEFTPIDLSNMQRLTQLCIAIFINMNFRKTSIINDNIEHAVEVEADNFIKSSNLKTVSTQSSSQSVSFPVKYNLVFDEEIFLKHLVIPIPVQDPPIIPLPRPQQPMRNTNSGITISNRITSSFPRPTLTQMELSHETEIVAHRRRDSIKFTGSLAYKLVRHGQAVLGEQYRIDISTHLNKALNLCPVMHLDDLIFQCAVNKLSSLESPISSSSTNGIIDGILRPQRAIPLALFSPTDSVPAIYASIDGLSLYFHEETQQHYLWLDSREACHATVIYDITEQANPALPSYSVPQPALTTLPTSLLIALNKLRNEPTLQFIFDHRLTLNQKLEQLCQFGLAFQDESLIIPENAYRLDVIINTLTSQSGACFQRSFVCWIIATFLGIKALFQNNGIHAWLEIVYGNHRIEKRDLGGAGTRFETSRQDADLLQKANNLRVTNSSQKTKNSAIKKTKQSSSLFSNITIKKRVTPQQPAQEVKQPPPIKNLNNQQKKIIYPTCNPNFLPYYRDLFAKINIPCIQTIAELVNYPSPLIIIQDDKEARDINVDILHYLREQHKDIACFHLYLEDPEEIFEFLAGLQLDADGTWHKERGPLQTVPLQEGAIIVIHWEKFDANLIARYQSLLDDPRTFNGLLTAKLTVVNLVRTQKSSNDFPSRCQEVIFQRQAPIAIQEEVLDAPNQEREVDLFGLRFHWKDILFGRYTFQGKKLHHEESPLLQAITLGETLIIKNPPNDPEFSRLKNRLENERKLFIEGRVVTVSPSFQIKLQSAPFIQPEQSPVHFVDQPPVGCRRFYCSINTFDDFFKQFTVINGEPIPEELSKQYIVYHGEPVHEDGFLQHYKPGEDVIVINGDLPRAYWNLLIHRMSTFKQTFTIYVSPGVTIEGVISTKPAPASSDSSIYFSNDPDYLAQQLLAKYPNSVMHAVSNTLSVDELLFASLHHRLPDNQLTFSLKKQSILEELMNGQTVILTGQLSKETGEALRSVLETPACLWINGEWKELTGKLVLVLPEEASYLKEKYPHQVIHYQWDDYAAEFPNQKEEFTRLMTFLRVAQQLPHVGQAMPKDLGITFSRVKRMLNKLSSPVKSLNPIKRLLHYDYDIKSEEYAYLNTLAKYLLNPLALENNHPLLNEKKLAKVLQRLDNHRASCWSILDCFYPAGIRQLLGEDWLTRLDTAYQPPRITEEQWQTINTYLTQHDLIVEPDEDLPCEAISPKLDNALAEFLANQDERFLLVKGSAGVGKTHTVKKWLGAHPESGMYYGMRQFKEWLINSKKVENPVLVLDEGNLAEPGTLEILKTLILNGSVDFEGETYRNLTHHKIIITGNQEYYAGRHYHDLFRQYAETFYLKEPTKRILREIIIIPTLLAEGIMPAMANDIASLLLDAYLFTKSTLGEDAVSLRDLIHLARRTRYLQKNSVDSPQEIVWLATTHAFAFAIKDENKRQQFMFELGNLLQVDVVAKPSSTETLGHLTIPARRSELMTILKENILLAPGSSKPGMLLIGNSGIGKSVLAEQLLIEQGYSLNHPNPKKRYYIINAGTPDATKIFRQAFKAGSKVIINELNLDEELEFLVSQCLDGDGLENNPDEKSEFAVIATQNPSYYKGRKAQSIALLNRFNILYCDDYTNEDLIDILKAYHIPQPEAWVHAYREKYPDTINLRQFFHALKVQEANPVSQDILLHLQRVPIGADTYENAVFLVEHCLKIEDFHSLYVLVDTLFEMNLTHDELWIKSLKRISNSLEHHRSHPEIQKLMLKFSLLNEEPFEDSPPILDTSVTAERPSDIVIITNPLVEMHKRLTHLNFNEGNLKQQKEDFNKIIAALQNADGNFIEILGPLKNHKMRTFNPLSFHPSPYKYFVHRDDLFQIEKNEEMSRILNGFSRYIAELNNSLEQKNIALLERTVMKQKQKSLIPFTAI